VVAGLVTLNAVAQFAPLTDDVWDVSQGTILILSTDLKSGSDMRDMLGGTFGSDQAEKGNVLFADGAPEGSTHIIEWRTKKAVTVRSFRLFAYDDPATGDHAFGVFRLKAKPVGSLTFDTVLFEAGPPHPYKYEDPATHLLMTGNVRPVEAQEFMAEFTLWNGQNGASANGPRIVELDASTEFIAIRPELRISETEVSWTSVPGVPYQIQFREKLSGSVWQPLGSPITGTGLRMNVSDYVPQGSAERYYRIVPLQ